MANFRLPLNLTSQSIKRVLVGSSFPSTQTLTSYIVKMADPKHDLEQARKPPGDGAFLRIRRGNARETFSEAFKHSSMVPDYEDDNQEPVFFATGTVALDSNKPHDKTFCAGYATMKNDGHTEIFTFHVAIYPVGKKLSDIKIVERTFHVGDVPDFSIFPYRKDIMEFVPEKEAEKKSRVFAATFEVGDAQLPFRFALVKDGGKEIPAIAREVSINSWRNPVCLIFT